MKSIVDDIIAEFTEMYREMSLLELLAEENMMVALQHKGELDKVHKILLGTLRSEIARKLQ